METEKIELQYEIQKNEGNSIKRFTRVLELDYVAVRELRTSNNRKETIQSLVGQFHPGYHVISGSFTSLPREKENTKEKAKKFKEENERSDYRTYEKSDSIWRRPHFMIPFRILWQIIKAIFEMFSIMTRS